MLLNKLSQSAVCASLSEFGWVSRAEKKVKNSFRNYKVGLCDFWLTRRAHLTRSVTEI